MLSLASRSARVSPRFFVTSAVVQEPAAAKKSKSKVAAKKTAAKKKTAATKNPVAQKKKPTEKEAASKKRVVAQKKRLAEKTKQAKALIPRNRICSCFILRCTEYKGLSRCYSSHHQGNVASQAYSRTVCSLYGSGECEESQSNHH
jgi:cell pole-organizing protein PopZ